MLDAGSRAYAYSKACGILSKSFVGKRISTLADINSISKLDKLVFPNLHRELPAKELLADFEKHVEKRAVRQILSILNAYGEPPLVLILMLRSYEYSDLKSCLHNILMGRKNLPVISDIGRFGTIKFDAFPNLKAMLKDTEFEFILYMDRTGLDDIMAIEVELDKLYYNGLKESLNKLSNDDKVYIQRILAEEISLLNCNWALRLRYYYGKTAAQTSHYLFDFKMQTGNGEVSLVNEALETLKLPLDMRESWRGWKWEKFLNPENQDDHWKLDPRYFQNAASQYLYRLTLRYFRIMPITINADFCFIRLKHYEEDMLTSVAEGLDFGMESADVLRMLGVPDGILHGLSSPETEE